MLIIYSIGLAGLAVPSDAWAKVEQLQVVTKISFNRFDCCLDQAAIRCIRLHRQLDIEFATVSLILSN